MLDLPRLDSVSHPDHILPYVDLLVGHVQDGRINPDVDPVEAAEFVVMLAGVVHHFGQIFVRYEKDSDVMLAVVKQQSRIYTIQEELNNKLKSLA